MSQTVASLVVESLIANGFDQLYCLPGVQNDDFFDALYDRQDALTPIQTRHEQGAAYMATGAAIATGQPHELNAGLTLDRFERGNMIDERGAGPVPGAH